ncbi:hypothetical protein FACS1894196_0880 [Clostridia bacterium]|nr:hypothetical protein FACS1894196_0880 [Clostridia bacterium]
MTSIRFCRTPRGLLRGFVVVGHTGAAPSGEDIVCAGISALTQTAVNALESVAGIKTHPRIAPGFLSVTLPRGGTARQRARAQIILRTVRRGLRDISASYPQYVRMERTECIK